MIDNVVAQQQAPNSQPYVRQHPYTKLGEDAVHKVQDLSMALDNAMEANQERCSTAHKALQARDEASRIPSGEPGARPTPGLAPGAPRERGAPGGTGRTPDPGGCPGVVPLVDWSARAIGAEKRVSELMHELEVVKAQRNEALQAREDALEDAKNLRERYAELQTSLHTRLVCTLPSYEAEHAEERNANLRAKLDVARSLTEQLEVQLAGCSVAALGGTKEPAERFSYAWLQPCEMDRNDWKENSDSWRHKYEAWLSTPTAAPRAGLYISYPEPDTETRVDLGPAQGIPGYMKEPVQVWKDNPKTTVLAEQTAECGLTVAEQVEGLRNKVLELERKLG